MYIMLVGFGRAMPPCAALTGLFRLNIKQKCSAIRAPLLICQVVYMPFSRSLADPKPFSKHEMYGSHALFRPVL